MPEVTPSKYVVQAGWDDAPHLDERTKRELLAATPEWLRDARSKGEPALGAGAIYPIPLSDIEYNPADVALGPFWKRAYGFDVGWTKTAAVWGAQDPSTGVIYLYAEHYRGRELPVIHANAIRSRGAWIRGAADAASTTSQRDGEDLLTEYRAEPCSLNLVQADKSGVGGPGIALEQIWQMLAFGRLKVSKHLQYWRQEYRGYQRDKDGKVIKKDDHLMDAMRYLIRTWDKVASLPPKKFITNGFGIADKLTGI